MSIQRIALLLTVFSCLTMMALSSPSYADSSIGRCFFYGDRPSSGTSIGGMMVYHNGTGRITGSRGSQQIYKVDGGRIGISPSRRVGHRRKAGWSGWLPRPPS